MQATRSPQRVVVAAVLAVMLVAGFAGIAGSACQTRPKVTGEAARQPAGLAEVERFTEALDRGQELNYSAEYATAEGISVTVAQSPPQRAYRTADSTYLFGPDAAYLCHLKTCQHVPGEDSMPLDQARSVATAFGGGFVVADHAAVLLARAAALPGAQAGRARRVIGDAAADCLAITVPAATTTGAGATPAGTGVTTGCVNTAGVLAYFEGTTELATPARIELRQFAATVPPEAFDLPPDAKTVDVDALGISE